MKIFKYIICAASLGLVFASCSDIDLEAKGIQDEATLFSSDMGVQTYLAKLYNKLPIEDFNYGVSGDQAGYRKFENNQWQAQKSSSGSLTWENTGRNGGAVENFNYWPYEDIRMVNTYLENLPLYKDKYDEAKFNELLAEGRFIRAFYYFGLAKRFGGVPLITEVQEPYASEEILQVSRATEYDTWKFIYEDLKFAMENGSKDKASIGRANRYTAAALASRAMLYAGSVAKYNYIVGYEGEAVDAGLQGMPQGKAAEFFQLAYEAGKMVREAGYKLHNGSDKFQAFTEVFTKENPGEEDIFVKRSAGREQLTIADAMGFCNQWGAMHLPKPISQFVGCAVQPLWDTIDLFEHPAIVKADGTPARFNSLEEFAESPDLEPRCKATFFFTGMSLPNVDADMNTIDLQAGVWTSFSEDGTEATSYLAADACQMEDQTEFAAGGVNSKVVRVRFNNPNTRANAKTGKVKGQDGKNYTFDPDMKCTGVHGMGLSKGDEEYGYTGAFVRKYINLENKDWRSEFNINGNTLSWKAFRYGEVLLNLAEAAYELGFLTNNEALKKEAIDYVNEIRERAGAHPYTYVSGDCDVTLDIYGDLDNAVGEKLIDANLQYIRDERAREMAYENVNYWDLRRWRVGHIIFGSTQFGKALQGYYVYDEKKYIFLPEYEFHMHRGKQWGKNVYYRQIPGDQINKNPLLIRNDGV